MSFDSYILVKKVGFGGNHCASLSGDYELIVGGALRYYLVWYTLPLRGLKSEGGLSLVRVGAT